MAKTVLVTTVTCYNSLGYEHLVLNHETFLQQNLEMLRQNKGRLGVRPVSKNPYPIDDENLPYSLPYLWPDQKFGPLYVNWRTSIIISPLVQTNVKQYRKHNLWMAFVDFCLDNDEKVASL